MGEKTKIEWTHHTFNAWIGCTKVSTECKNCYAEVETYPRVQRGKGRELWGERGDRHVTSDDNWKALRRWNREARVAEEQRRVFVNSMSDVGEQPERDDTRALLDATRLRLWAEIEACENLTFLLLTKRPENLPAVLPATWLKEPRKNVWLGTTAGTQKTADERLPRLLEVGAAVHFMSGEPLLEQIEIEEYLHDSTCLRQARKTGACICSEPRERHLGWVICGGESGRNPRELNYRWARHLLAQCKVATGVAFFMKQAGAVVMDGEQLVTLKHRKGGDLLELPRDLRVREFPRVA